MDKWLTEIREKISCPQLGDDHYGEWGILTQRQRFTIKRMLDYIEAQETFINHQKAEIKELQDLMVKYNGDFAKQEAEIERLLTENHSLAIVQEGFKGMYKIVKAEAYKEVYLKLQREVLVRGEVDVEKFLKTLVGENDA